MKYMFFNLIIIALLGCSYTRDSRGVVLPEVSDSVCLRAESEQEEFVTASQCGENEQSHENIDNLRLRENLRLVIDWFNRCNSGDCGSFQESFSFCNPMSLKESTWSVRAMKSMVSIEIPCSQRGLTFVVAEIGDGELTPHPSILELDITK